MIGESIFHDTCAYSGLRKLCFDEQCHGTFCSIFAFIAAYFYCLIRLSEVKGISITHIPKRKKGPPSSVMCPGA